MSDFPIELRLAIGLEPDADEAELEAATLQLQQELLDVEVDQVVRPEVQPPPGARAADATILGALVVGLTRDAIGAVARTILGWVSRHATRTVKLAIDGDSVEVTGASTEDQERLIELFLSRHVRPAE